MKTLALNSQKQIYQIIQHYFVILFAFDTLLLARASSHHLELATRLLASGKYSDALPHFHEAINDDPTNYLTYFKRATVFLALNRPKSALEDLDKALELNKDFKSALNQRASLHLKMGNLDEAELDYERILISEPDNKEANDMYDKVERLKSLKSDVKSMISNNRHDESLVHLNKLIETIPWNHELLKMRATAFEKSGETRRAITDLRNLAKLTVDAKTYLSIAKLSYRLGEIEESLNSVRECLKLDPDDKSCMEFYKPTKKLNNYVKKTIDSKNSKDNDECNLQGRYALELLDNQKSPLAYSIKSVMCHCLSRAGDTKEGLKVCSEVLKNEGDEVENIAIERSQVLCDKADLLADNEEYAEAMKLYQESQKLKPSNRAKQGVEKMNRLKKQKGKRDYYKILGVDRTAGDEEIKKAYRKLAAKSHPDRFHDKSGKKKAQAKFMDIADARAVLTDPEKRRIFDQGEDPLDPESKHGSHQHPHHGFYQDFQHFGGGAPFQFKFNFG